MPGAIEGVVEAVLGNVEGFSTLVGLAIIAKWLRRGARFGDYLELLAYFAAFLLLLTAAGVIEGIDVARLLELGAAVMGLVGDLVRSFL